MSNTNRRFLLIATPQKKKTQTTHSNWEFPTSSRPPRWLPTFPPWRSPASAHKALQDCKNVSILFARASKNAFMHISMCVCACRCAFVCMCVWIYIYRYIYLSISLSLSAQTKVRTCFACILNSLNNPRWHTWREHLGKKSKTGQWCKRPALDP